MRSVKWCVVVVLLAPNFSRVSRGYVDSSPTLGNLIYVAKTATLMTVDKVLDEKQIIVLRKSVDLKGTLAQDRVMHVVKDDRNPQVAKSILDWAEPGSTVICFTSGTTTLVYTGELWFQSAAAGPALWRMSRPRPELDLAYVGTVQKLRMAVAAVVAKKQFVVTAVSLRNRRENAYDDAAFQHHLAHGTLPPLWRIRVGPDMPGLTISLVDSAKDSQWIVGPGAGSTDDVPPLISALQSDDPDVRADAAKELRLLGKVATSAITALKGALNDRSPAVRIHSAGALARIEPGNSAALETLMAIINDAKAPRRRAIETLADLGPVARGAVPLLIHLLDDADVRVRESAVRTLGAIAAESAEAVPHLVQLLDDAQLAAASADALGNIGPPARSALPRLIAAITGSQADLRWVSATAVIRIDPSVSEPGIPVLIEGLKSTDERTRWDARHCFIAMGPTRIKAIPALERLLKEPDDYVAWNATHVLGTLGPDLRGSVPLFIQMTQSDNRAERLNGIFLLRSTGHEAKAGITVLETVAKDPDPEIQKAANEALKAIGR